MNANQNRTNEARENDATDETNPQSPMSEVLEADHQENEEYEFYATIRTRLHNPNGSDVITLRIYKARPKCDRLVPDEDLIYSSVSYWWVDTYPSQGDTPLKEHTPKWRPIADLDDDDALLKECIEAATFEPKGELESLRGLSDRIRRKLDQGADPEN
jgi:hypothetical protein